MPSFRVRFLPDDIEVSLDDGKTLLEAARIANVYVGAICGGDGTCGKCRLVVREGEVVGESTDFLSLDEIRRGYVLACQVTPQSDLVVLIPPESRLSGYVGIGKDSERFRDFTRDEAERPLDRFDPLVNKFYLELPEPSLDDPTGDQERLLAALAQQHPSPLQMGLKTCQQLPRILRRLEKGRSSWSWTWDGRVTATIGSRSDVHEVLCVESGNTRLRNFGLALDVGTTTVVAHLVDLVSGATREAAAKYNSQIKFGADVISRINYARQAGGPEEVHRAITQDIDALIDDIVVRSGIGRGDIQCVVAAGNTAMLHFLLGLESDLIRIAPFTPAALAPPPVRAAELGIRIHPRGLLYSMPMVGSFVGGDITSGILACGMDRSDEISLLIDLGTNGELVLGNRDFLVASSASAGPAFEGGSIACGMRATSGAIDSVRIAPDDGRIELTTIDGGTPVGLCGTGLIDALAQMFLAGLVDRSGRFQVDRDKGRFRFSRDDDTPEFLLHPRGDDGVRDVVITQSDAENLIRTKAAIYAAVACLIESVGLTFGDIQRVFIAGAFGKRLNVANCVTIGLLPDVPVERMRFIGNSSVAGAKLVMLHQEMFDLVRQIRERITYEELMANTRYMDDFVSACFLPHTDLSQFPSLAAQSPAANSPATNSPAASQSGAAARAVPQSRSTP